VAPDFNPSSNIINFANVPRFGHSSNPLAIFLFDEISDDGSIESPRDYALGLLFLPIMLTAIPFLWLIILLILKCLGGRRVGFLSGVRFVEESNIFDSRRRCRPSVIALFMVALGAAGMLASYLSFATLATDEYLGAVDTIRGGWNDLIALGDDAASLSDQLSDVVSQAQTSRDNIQTILDNGGICSSTGQLVVFPTDYDDELSTVITLLDEVVNEFDIVSIPSLAIDSEKNQEWEVDNTFDRMEFFMSYSRFFLIPVGLVGVLMGIGVLMTALFSEKFYLKALYCSQTWFTLPLVGLLAIIMGIFAGGLGVIAVINADFCSPTPEDVVTDIGNQVFDSISDFDFLNYYIIDGCQGELAAITEIEEAINEFRNVKDDADDVKSLFTNQQVELEKACFGCLPGDACPGAAGSLDSFGRELDLLIALSDQIDVTADAALDLTNCQRVNSIYIDMVHEGICQDTMSASTWAFSTFVAASFCGLFIMTFRAGAYPVEDLGFFEKKDTYDQNESFEEN